MMRTSRIEVALNDLHIMQLTPVCRVERINVMSTKILIIPDGSVPFAWYQPARLLQEKGQDLFPPALALDQTRFIGNKLPPCNNAFGTNKKFRGYLDLVAR